MKAAKFGEGKVAHIATTGLASDEDVPAIQTPWDRASASYAASRRDALTEQLIADAHAAPIDLDASLSDAALADTPAVREYGTGVQLQGAQLEAYLRFVKATQASRAAQEAVAAAAAEMREATGLLARAIDEEKWKR